MDDRDQGFAEYFSARANAMRGTAYLLCGDWHRAEDLVQNAFVKLYRAWNLLRDAQNECYYISVRRRSLMELCDLIGIDAYCRSQMPPHLPIWHLPTWR